MHNLVTSIHKKWLDTKRYAANKYRRYFPHLARQLDECSMFTGEETLPELVELVFSPQGREFMLANNFPSIVNLRKFKPYHPEQFGIYIDCGEITLQDPGDVFLIGDTTAKIICKELKANNIILMHGAKAEVEAAGYAVVHIEKDRKSKCEVFIKDYAKVL